MFISKCPTGSVRVLRPPPPKGASKGVKAGAAVSGLTDALMTNNRTAPSRTSCVYRQEDEDEATEDGVRPPVSEMSRTTVETDTANTTTR